ncbi:MAG: ClbS/DfsB family four-helix bundle protein [Chloroflexi bacterium]|nr:ClbS/DfsB family four-helix bundle protein [Chloroflexota bacterium]
MHNTLDKAKLLDLLRAEYAFAERTLALLTPEQMKIGGVCGPWSVKDLIAHLTAWERRLLMWLENARKGIPLVIPQIGYTWAQIDQLNQQTALEESVKLLPQLINEARRTRELVLAQIYLLPEADLFEETPFSALFHHKLLDAIASNTYEHYAEHMEQIRAWMNKRTSG